ncbi:MAG: TRAP transporter substrate-binding protein [Candidatus Aminicenantaceae bacterium]
MKKMRLEQYLGIDYFLLLSVILSLNIHCKSPSLDRPLELKLSISFPATHPFTVNAYEVWAKKVGDVTDGRVKINIFPGGILTSVADSYDATRRGACDMAMLVQPYEEKRFPLTMIMNQPLSIPNARVSSLVAWELYQSFPEIRREYKDVKLLFFYSTSAYQIHTVSKPINTIEDFHGVLMRVGGPVDKAIAEAVGATPEFLPMPDTYLALGKGVLDALMSPFGPMKGFRTADVTRFHLENADLHTSIFANIMNLDKWNSLPRDIQEAIEEISGAAASEFFGSVFDETDRETIQYMKEQGDFFTRLSPDQKSKLEQLLLVIQEEWVKEQEANGLPGQKILDKALRMTKEYTSGELRAK